MFKHKAIREIKDFNEKTLLMVQALRGLGKEGITESSIRIMRRFFSEHDKERILKEIQSAPTWIYNVAAKILSGDGGSL